MRYPDTYFKCIRLKNQNSSAQNFLLGFWSSELRHLNLRFDRKLQKCVCGQYINTTTDLDILLTDIEFNLDPLRDMDPLSKENEEYQIYLITCFEILQNKINVFLNALKTQNNL